MQNPQPIHLTTDDEWRAAGWTFVARDSDGHTISVSGPDEDNRDWLERGLTITDLRKPTQERDDV
jgi:hypothetical protein